MFYGYLRSSNNIYAIIPFHEIKRDSSGMCNLAVLFCSSDKCDLGAI